MAFVGFFALEHGGLFLASTESSGELPPIPSDTLGFGDPLSEAVPLLDGKNREPSHGVGLCRMVRITVIFAVWTTASVFAGGGSGSVAKRGASVARDLLGDRLTQIEKLRLDPQLARLLADSIPPSVGRFFLGRKYVPAIGLNADCLLLDSATGTAGQIARGQRIYVFSKMDESLYVIVVEHEAESWRAIWSRTDPGGLPQPKLWLTTLGIEGDSALTIGMVGLVGARVYKSYNLIEWTGHTGHQLAGFGGLWLREQDLNRDGISELIVGQEDRSATKDSHGRAGESEDIYYFNAAQRAYRLGKDTSGSVPPPR